MMEMINALKRILIPLFDIQFDTWFAPEMELRSSSQVSKIFQNLSEKWEPIGAFEEIGHSFKSSEVVLDFSNRVLYLEPLLQKKTYFVPILSLSCTLNKTQSSAQFKVMLVCLDQDEKLHSIGFRMETPESMNQSTNTVDNDGNHDFYHAQLIRKFDQRAPDNKQGFDCPDWLPLSQPSFPLPADCPVTLLLCLIVTLYGRNYYNEFLKIHGTSDTQGYADKLDKWINSEQLEKKQRDYKKKLVEIWGQRKSTNRIGK